MPFVAGFLGKPKGRLLRHYLRGRFPGAPDIGLPDEPDGEGGEDGEDDDLDFWGGERPGRPSLPPDFERPSLPPREDWPPLPPWFTDERPGQGLPLPIPPRPGAPTVPLPPDPEIDELPEIWPPFPGTGLPGLPDLGGKTLALVTIHVSRRVHFVRWMVIDHEEAKSKLQRAIAWMKERMPAGGIAGRPPQRPGGAPEAPGQHR